MVDLGKTAIKAEDSPEFEDCRVLKQWHAKTYFWATQGPSYYPFGLICEGHRRVRLHMLRTCLI